MRVRIFMNLLGLLLGMACLGACAEERAGDEADDLSDDAQGEQLEASEQELTTRLGLRRMKWHGQPGGTIFPQQGQGIITAVKVWSDSEIRQISFQYYVPSRSTSNLHAGEPLFWTSALGASRGVEHVMECPPGQGVIGFRGSDNRRIDRLGIICSNVNNPSPDNVDNYYSPEWGGNGGDAYSGDFCPAGWLTYAVDVQARTTVHALQGFCAHSGDGRITVGRLQ